MRINVNDKEAIEAALADVQHRASVNTFTAQDVLGMAANAERRLERLHLAKKARPAAEYRFRYAGPTARSYKNRQGATYIKLQRGSSDWFAVELARVEIWPQTPELAELVLTKEQDALAVAALRCTYAVNKTLAERMEEAQTQAD
jgi:hypothetical protein